MRRASAIILYRFKPELELFVVRRSEALRAFPGQWTFPGGHFEAQDQTLPELYADLEQAADRQTALRELFEETGLLPFGKFKSPSERHVLREALLSTELSWPAFCEQINYQPPLDQLISLGVRVSPPITPRRFYTWYFLLEASGLDADEQPLALSGELAEAGWFRPVALLQRWQVGQTMIPAPVLGVLEALQNVPAITALELKALRALSNSETQLYEPILVHPGIEMLPLKTPTIPPASHTNTYLLGAENFVVIDPATPFKAEQEILKERIKDRLQRGHQLQGILLTHHHPDHIGAVDFLRDWLHAPVFAHAATAERLAGKLKIDRCVGDGFLWDLGLDSEGLPWLLQAVHTPGHAPGHLCFVDLRHNVAMVGDMLAGFGTILIKRPRGNVQDYLDSLQKLIDLQLLRALPAHGPMIVKPGEYCQHYIQHRLMREQKILTALEQGPLSEDDLLARVYADIDPRAITLARWTLDAHLHKLLSEQRVVFVSQTYRLQ